MHKIKKFLRGLAHNNKLVAGIYNSLNRVKVNMLSYLNDDVFAKINYRENTGKRLNLNNPKTFNEKLWWLKSNYRIPLMTECSDKVKVVNYLERLGLEKLLNPRYGVYSSFEEIPFSEMKGKFYIKCNHVSGINSVFDSNATDAYDYERNKSIFNRALKSNYYYQSREWNYKNIEPKILVEYFLEEDNLLDYKFLCFHGKVKLCFIDKNVATESGSHNLYATRNVYDRDFNLQTFTVGRDGFEPSLVSKPDNYDEMILIAEQIAKPFPFCRVDLYNLNGEIRFGEITFYPGGATQQFSSEEWDLKVGSWIKL